MSDTDADLTALIADVRAKAEAATPGPWEPRIAPREGYSLDEKAEYMRGSARDNGEPLHVLIAESLDPSLAYIVPALTGDGPTSEANAEHIARMDPATTLRLVDAVERLARERDDARAESERLWENWKRRGVGPELAEWIDGARSPEERAERASTATTAEVLALVERAETAEAALDSLTTRLRKLANGFGGYYATDLRAALGGPQDGGEGR